MIRSESCPSDSSTRSGLTTRMTALAGHGGGRRFSAKAPLGHQIESLTRAVLGPFLCFGEAVQRLSTRSGGLEGDRADVVGGTLNGFAR